MICIGLEEDRRRPVLIERGRDAAPPDDDAQGHGSAGLAQDANGSEEDLEMPRLSRRSPPVILALLAYMGAAHAGPYTGTGGGPETTINAPYRSAVGQTVPPGAAAAPLHDPNRRTQRQKDLDAVLGSICRAC
jgi:hypothetical protein